MLEKNNKDKKIKKPAQKNTKKTNTKKNDQVTDVFSSIPEPKSFNYKLFVNITYALMIITPTMLVGLIMAFILLNTTKEKWIQSHLRFIIQTVIYSFAALFIGFISMYHVTSAFFYIVGFVIIVVTGIWYYLRIIGGWLTFNQNRAIQGYFGVKYQNKKRKAH